MSELFDDDSRGTQRARSGSRRSRALIITAVVLVLFFLGLSTFAGLYTDRLWYDDLRYLSVFTTLFWTKTLLFLVFGVLMALAVGVNVYLAYRFRPFFRPNSPEQSGLDRYRDAVSPIRTWLLVGVSVVLGIFAGSSGVGEWRSYLLWRNGVPFNQKDAWFKRDIGFYVFDLPWMHYLVNFAMAVLVVAIIAAALVHYLYGGIRLQTPRDRLSGAAQAQLSVLLGLFVVAKAVDYWLDRFDLVNGGGGVVTGMNYTDYHAVLPAKNILLGIAAICAVLFFVNVWRRTWLLPSVGLALLAVSAILLGLIWPGIVQQFQVSPSEADKEAPYIKKNIDATRAAYDIADVERSSYDDNSVATSGELAALMAQTKSVPLVDPQLVHQTFEQEQQVRAYYSVADVLDVDRYDIEGTDRAVVLGVRELNQDDLPDTDKNWSNLHTVYTHGNGIIAAYANQRPADNGPEKATDTQWAEGLEGEAQHSLTQATGDYETRVYFGEQSPGYSVVGKEPNAPAVELDLPTGAGATAEDAGSGGGGTTTYGGAGGVPVGSFFNKFMYAVKFGEPNFLLSERVNSNSEVLYNRDPRVRVEKVAPWLTIDGDPYPAVVDGKIEWILDGYTTTDRYPNAEKDSFAAMTDDSRQLATGLRTLPTDEINYMRNAVKATVDAYDGTVTLYEWDESDPILHAWMKAFPGTVQPKEDIPAALMSHLRYPEDMFKVQRYQYARYHVTDPVDFYTANNRWDVPDDPNASGHLQPPYRLFVNETAKDGSPTGKQVWSLTSNFVPIGRSNLAAFVSVDSDATDPENYGKMRVLELQDTQTKGPGQIANEFSSNQEVSGKLLRFRSGGSPPRFGNLLTLPVNDGLIYVEPVYAERVGTTGGYPLLQYVLVSYGGRVGIGDTLTQALTDVLGGTPITGNNGGTNGGTGHKGSTQPIEEQIRSLLLQAQRKFQRADAALRDGDLAKYSQLTDQGKALVNRAVALSNQLPQGGSSPSASPSGSASKSPSSSASSPSSSGSASS